ncbi:ABC transporter ATP-binding protein [Lachnotalea glycerini]|nr:ATP-binding cassette domain-containing protein [Lachnotalea glycerini]
MSEITVKNLEYIYKRVKNNNHKSLLRSIPILNLVLKRDFEKLKAVDNISFNINKGDVVAFIGPNGAGKSTTIKMLTGLLEPTSGEISINGFNLQKEKNKYLKNIGVVFGQRTQLWWELPVMDSFNLLKDIYEVDEQEFKDRMKWYNEIVNINKLLDIPVKNLSLGQRMLCEILASFLHKPSIIFLDEPTIGLDVSIKNKIRKFITVINKTYKTTIVITTHDSGDIEKLANKVILINKGSIAYDGTFLDFMKMYGNKKIIQIKPTFKLSNGLEEIKKMLSSFRNIDIYVESDWIIIKLDQNSDNISKIISILQLNKTFDDIIIKPATLEEVLVPMYYNYGGEKQYDKTENS